LSALGGIDFKGHRAGKRDGRERLNDRLPVDFTSARDPVTVIRTVIVLNVNGQEFTARSADLIGQIVLA